MDVDLFLLSLGAPAHRVGFGQLSAAISYVLAHPEATHITRDIYPAVATLFGTTSLCVDHNMRSIIEQIWLYGNQELLRELFFAPTAYRPSNKAFIFTVAKHLAVEQKREQEARRRHTAVQPPPVSDKPPVRR